MKVIKTQSLILLILISLFIQCKGSQPVALQSTPPFVLAQAPYYQAWIAGIPGGGSGINVFIPVEGTKGFDPDSLHFRGQRVKAVYQNKRIVGRFDTPHNQKKDLVLSQNVLKEMHNSLLAAGDRSPFPLRNNACILSYQVQNKRYYYKIEALQQQPSIAYPSAPPD